MTYRNWNYSIANNTFGLCFPKFTGSATESFANLVTSYPHSLTAFP